MVEELSLHDGTEAETHGSAATYHQNRSKALNLDLNSDMGVREDAATLGAAEAEEEDWQDV
ncbi:hypothetical protein RvY_04277 [Ramazzottius varieornatus]|uniref:Uncharacterized protein n=1 Tax=Ramazzottius varieornatus TaxID=947166 RepID=A0A1D1UUG4_RAMVA|nr:hypothetical protein RvY_04277 [Ramazzottius varieornatus]